MTCVEKNKGITGTSSKKIASARCHAAVRAGDTLAPMQVRALLDDLDAIDLGAHCPHGRPVVRTLDYTELADWFDR